MKTYFEYKGYIGTVAYSAEDDCFFGMVHGVNGLVSFEGQTVDELKTAFHEAVDDYLSFCREHNDTCVSPLDLEVCPHGAEVCYPDICEEYHEPADETDKAYMQGYTHGAEDTVKKYLPKLEQAYQQGLEAAEHDMRDEHTYNPEDGSM